MKENSSQSRKALPELAKGDEIDGGKKKRPLLGALSFFVEEPVSLKN
jgi:hypothetical protein